MGLSVHIIGKDRTAREVGGVIVLNDSGVVLHINI
jgi:hypothetical protein